MMNVKPIELVIMICVYTCMFVHLHRTMYDIIVPHEEQSCHQSGIFVTANETKLPVKSKKNSTVAFDSLSKITILLALILTTVIELSTLFGLVVYWRVAREAPVQPRLCFPSSAFASNVDDLQKLKKENDMYCGNASYVLHILVNQTVAEKYNNNANPEHSTIDFRGDSCTPSDTDGLMLKLDSISLHAKPVPEKPTKIYWTTSAKFNKMQDMQFSVDEGSLYIQKSGYYHISSQLTSRMENETIGESNDQTLKHFLISYRNGTERILLEDVKSPCELAVEMSEYTSTMGAVFYLKERDRIYVATSHPYHLLSGDSVNYLSILKT